jgi:hypothetical protein
MGGDCAHEPTALTTNQMIARGRAILPCVIGDSSFTGRAHWTWGPGKPVALKLVGFRGFLVKRKKVPVILFTVCLMLTLIINHLWTLPPNAKLNKGMAQTFFDI